MFCHFKITFSDAITSSTFLKFNSLREYLLHAYICGENIKYHTYAMREHKSYCEIGNKKPKFKLYNYYVRLVEKISLNTRDKATSEDVFKAGSSFLLLIEITLKQTRCMYVNFLLKHFSEKQFHYLIATPRVCYSSHDNTAEMRVSCFL